MTTTFDLEAARQALEEERAKLIHQLDELGADEKGDLRSDVDYGDGFSDAAAATAERTERIGLVESLMGMLSDVKSALVKIGEGTYGICSSCGEEISAARLEARPESTLCVNCKSKRR